MLNEPIPSNDPNFVSVFDEWMHTMILSSQNYTMF